MKNINFNKVLSIIEKLNKDKGYKFVGFHSDGIEFSINFGLKTLFDSTKESIINPDTNELYTLEEFKELLFNRIK